MPGDSSLRSHRLLTGAQVPAALRLVISAASGAALSLSFTGLYLSIYSWVCVGVLLFILFRAERRIAFGSGFLHGLFFVFTSVPWIATVLAVHGGLSTIGGWAVLLLIAIAWGILTGSFAWAVHRLSRRSIALACIGAPFVWATFEFVRAHLPEFRFLCTLLGYPAAANAGLVQVTTITGIYGLSFLVAGFNALLAWTAAADASRLKRRVAISGATTTVLLSAALAGPRLVP